MADIPIYFASKFENRLLLKCFIRNIQSIYPEIVSTSSWLIRPTAHIREAASIDYTDIDNSKYLVAVAPFTSSTNSEMGYALGQGKKVFYVVDKEIYLGTTAISVNNRLPLPAAILDYPYNKKPKFINGKGLRDDVEFKIEYIIEPVRGFIVHSIDDMVSIIKKLEGSCE